MKLNKIYFSVIFILLLSASCNTKNYKFNMIQSKGLDAENLGLQTMLFYNTDIGLIGGSSDEVTSNPNQSSDTFAFVNRIALLYKTVDGGKHWKALKFGDGYFNQLIQVKNKTFAIKKSKDNLHTTVYSSVNMGESWEECKSFPEGAYNFFGINNTLIAIATQDRVLTHVYLSGDDGIHWKQPVDPELGIGDCISLDTKLIYHHHSQEGEDFIVEYDMQSLKSTKISFPAFFDYYSLTSYSNQVKLCGKQDNKIAVYSLINNKLQYEYSTPEKDSMSFPVAFYNTKNEDYIILGRRRTGDVEHKILKTANNGKTWETIKFERDNLIAPFYFLNDNDKVKAWFFAGSGKFQVLQ